MLCTSTPSAHFVTSFPLTLGAIPSRSHPLYHLLEFPLSHPLAPCLAPLMPRAHTQIHERAPAGLARTHARTHVCVHTCACTSSLPLWLSLSLSLPPFVSLRVPSKPKRGGRGSHLIGAVCILQSPSCVYTSESLGTAITAIDL